MELKSLPVFYTPAMVADSGSFSPSASKPAHVIESWKRLGIPIDILMPLPVTTAQLKLAHDPDMVDDILAGRRDNGFGNRLVQVAESLLHTSGAMLGAAREAIRNGKVAVAPVSGFHHASYDDCGGYCTFNGLIVTAQVLLGERACSRIGIIDFDQHYGDGTDDCIQRLGLRSIQHFSAGELHRPVSSAEEFISGIDGLVSGMNDCDLILYQAGADPHVDDPLGGWMTGVQLAGRDRAFFAAANRLGIPVAWNLAGGYQKPLEKVLAIHDQTLLACAETYLWPAR